MTKLQADLAAFDRRLDAHGVLTGDPTGDSTGMMVSLDELTQRRKIEGKPSPIMCGGCGYGLAPADKKCPKCGSGSREEATAFVERDLSALLDGHKADIAMAPPGSPLAAARATGMPPASPEYRRAYVKAQYLANMLTKKAKRKAKHPPPLCQAVRDKYNRLRRERRAAAKGAKA